MPNNSAVVYVTELTYLDYTCPTGPLGSPQNLDINLARSFSAWAGTARDRRKRFILHHVKGRFFTGVHSDDAVPEKATPTHPTAVEDAEIEFPLSREQTF